LYDPMFKVKDAKTSKAEETKKRQHLITPLHEGDVNARCWYCQSPGA
jgi:hypothetical protein